MTAADLCITADDYGLDEAINRGIESLAASGAISAVSVMCHRGAQLQAARALPQTGAATGIHLVFVEEEPVLPADRLAGLVDRNGKLPRNYGVLFAQIAARPRVLEILRAEARAQLDRYRELGLPLDFVNSHQHVHLFPPIWRALADEIEAAAPGAIRAAPRLQLHACKAALLTASSCASLIWRRPRRPLWVPHGIEAAGHLDERTLEKICRLAIAGRRWTPDLLPELVVHPGHGSPSAEARYGGWGYRWSSELELLGSPRVAGLLRELGLRVWRKRCAAS
jgi:predicted glycoside hydrolase/deacetylase ChbG (UPF0249 family)